MDIVFFGIILLTFIGSRIFIGGGYSSTFLCREQTTAVNGVFVMLVFLRHFKEYIECGPYDRLFWTADGCLGQLIVTTFLFYSGYGMWISLKKKPGYLQTIPKRIFRVWVSFAVAVCLFVLLNLALGKHYSLSTILLSFTAWQSVGNSNWYILAILVLYFLTWCGGLLKKGSSFRTIAFVCAGCACYTAVLILCRKGEWYYDTVFCYPAGMLWGEYEQQIRECLEIPKRYLIAFVGSAVVFVVSYLCESRLPGLAGLAALELRSVLFAVLVVLATMKVQIGNPVLSWLGRYTFEIYIIQRIPMIALAGRSLGKYPYFLLCLGITGVIAVLYRKGISALLRHGCNNQRRGENQGITA